MPHLADWRVSKPQCREREPRQSPKAHKVKIESGTWEARSLEPSSRMLGRTAPHREL